MRFIKYKTIDSTNTRALERFEELEQGDIISADCQTNGRGRFDRKWVSEDCENIYVSFVLKPKNHRCAANLTQYMSVVVLRILKTYGISPKIKWPNDVLVQGKKICGILCEAYRKKNVTRGYVLGAGINLNMPENVLNKIDKPSASLNLLLGKKVDKDEFLMKLADEFFKNYEVFCEKGFPFIKEEYMENTEFLNKKVYIQQRDGDEKKEYTALSINDEGNLVVCDTEGAVSTIYSGDLIL